jgi:hypothetical protein
LARDDGAGLTHTMLKGMVVDKLFTTHYVHDDDVYWRPSGPPNKSQNWVRVCEKAWQSEYTYKMECYFESAAAGACMECGRSRSGKGSTSGRSVCARPRGVCERMGLVGRMRPDSAGRKMERQCEHFHGGPYRVSNAWLSDQLSQHTQ